MLGKESSRAAPHPVSFIIQLVDGSKISDKRIQKKRDKQTEGERERVRKSG